MIISGLQKLTLLDFPGKVACTVFFAGCNFRCPFCHNAQLVNNQVEKTYKTEEFFDFLKKRQGVLDGVCITGGEPLLQANIEQFIRQIKELGFKVKLDTNGSFYEKLKDLIEKNLLDYVAMDVKNSQSNYKKTIVSGEEADVFKSIDFLLEGNVDYEFRTTIVKQLHTENDIEEIAKRISGAKRYFLQNFEDSGNLLGNNLSAVEKQTLLNMREIALKYVKNVEIRGI